MSCRAIVWNFVALSKGRRSSDDDSACVVLQLQCIFIMRSNFAVRSSHHSDTQASTMPRTVGFCSSADSEKLGAQDGKTVCEQWVFCWVRRSMMHEILLARRWERYPVYTFASVFDIAIAGDKGNGALQHLSSIPRKMLEIIDVQGYFHVKSETVSEFF